MKKLLSLLLASALMLLSACGVETPKKYEINQTAALLTVHFIDVGQGDSTLLESGGEFVLIDAGEKEYGSSVVKYIRSRGAQSLKYVIATHPHSDHVGGLTKVINSVKTEHFITVETDQTSRTWMNVLDAVDKNDVDFLDAVVGETYSFGEAEFTILAPLSDNYSGYNNYSVVTRVTCGNVSFLLTGDAEKESEKQMLKSGADLSATVLKCGHHGSHSSSSADFLRAVNPDYAVISCGKNNEYGHPHKETIKKLNILGCPYYRTDEYGTIIACTDGKSLTFFTADNNRLTESVTVSASGEDETAPFAYVGNKNSMVFHYADCSAVTTMSDKNKVPLDSREEAIALGYSPCGACEP